MEYTSLIFPGDKIDIFASGLSDNSTSYKSSFSDNLTVQYVGNNYAS